MSTFLQLTFAGLSIGTLYMLIALGMVVTYQVAKVESLAQGVYVVYGALVFTTVHDSWRQPLAVAMGASVAACAVLACALYAVSMNKLAGRSSTGPVLMLLGSALLFSELAKRFWGLDSRSARPWLSNEPFQIGGATLLPHTLLVWVGTAVLVVVGFFLFERTLLGKALRAAADDVQGARLVGINAHRMRFISFQVAGLFGAVAGVLLAPVMPFGWSSIFPLMVVGAIGAISGRWEYVPAALASLAIGLFASYAGGYVSTSWQDVYVYGAFVVVLLLLREDRRAGARRRSRLGGLLRTRLGSDRAASQPV